MNRVIYRIINSIKYHLSSNETVKGIIEINRFRERVRVTDNLYIIEELGLDIPKGPNDFIFSNFEGLIRLKTGASGRFILEDDELFFIHDGLKYFISSPSEIFILVEVLVNKCYSFNLPDKNIVVIDIGMNVGIASLYFSSLDTVKKVYGFEPFKPTFNLALKNFKNNNKSYKIIPHNYGLGLSDKTIELPYNPTNSGINQTIGTRSSSYDGDSPLENVEIHDCKSEFQNLISEMAEDDCLVMKVDTEGAEFEILESIFNSGLVKRVKLYMIEWHNNSPSVLIEEFTKFGFSCMSFNYSRNTGMIYAFRTS